MSSKSRILSYLTLWWYNPMISLGFKKPLTENSFQEASLKLNLTFQQDHLWDLTLKEASSHLNPYKLRRLFTYMLKFGRMSNPIKLWLKYKSFMIEDFKLENLTILEKEFKALEDIEKRLKSNLKNLSLSTFNLPPITKSTTFDFQ